MNKQIARVDEYINEAVRHIAAVNNILQMLRSGDMMPSETQYKDIATLENAAKSCNELTKTRYIKTVKHAKLTPAEIIKYVESAKHYRRVSDHVNEAVAFKEANIRAKL
jgi:hypothetical protein